MLPKNTLNYDKMPVICSLACHCCPDSRQAQLLTLFISYIMDESYDTCN